MKSNETWIDRLERKRDAFYSAVMIVVTNDDKRIKEYIKHLDPSDKRVFVYDTYSGLTERKKDARMDTRTDVPVGKDDMFADPMASIRKALFDMEKRGDSVVDVTVVIKNILAKEDVVNKALNMFSTNDELLAMNRTLVLFTPDKTLVNPQVLEKCQLIEPPLSLPSERRALLEGLLASFKLTLDQDIKDRFVLLTGGLDLNQTEGVLCETLNDYFQTKVIDLSLVADVKSDQINKSSVLRVKSNVKLGFERVGGYEAVKQFIRESIVLPLKEPERAKRIGIEQPKGAIIFGPPGTGKTIIAEALAKELTYPFVTLDPENFMSSYVGESERNLRSAIQVIEGMAPVIVFIDEIDKLGGRGNSGETTTGGNTTGRLFSQILMWLGDQNRRSIVIGATNVPYMDEAFRREGRFDVLIPMLSPDRDARAAILDVHLNKVRKIAHDITPEQIVLLADMAVDWKGNMLEELVKRAARTAFVAGKENVSFDDMLEAYNDYLVPHEALKETEEKYRKMAKDLCNSQRFLDLMNPMTVGGNGRQEAVAKKLRGLPTAK